MRGRPSATLVLASLVGAALVVRPLLHGVELPTLVGFWATALGQVVLPGVLLVRGARLGRAGDGWLWLGQGATLGLALQGVALVAGRALGAPWLTTLVALAAVAVGWQRARLDRQPWPAPPPLAPVPTLAVALVAVLLQPLSSTGRLGEPVPFDLLFHAGTAAELRHRWPLEDPRVAGVPLHYHVLAYALPVEGADVSGAPLADPLLGVAPLFWVALLALQLANAGRLIFGSGRAGALAGAVALFHADAGEALGLGPGAFNSHLATAIFGSPTTVCGFILLLGLALALEGWLETARRRELAALALLAAAASAAKTTVLPVVLGGLAITGARALLRRRPAEARRFLAALAVVAAAGAPFTLWQTIGADSYSRMAHFGVGGVVARSGFATAVAAWLGRDGVSASGALVLWPLWLAGWLGLGGVAAAGWLVRRPGPLRPAQVWALSLAAVALVATLLLDTPDLSQLFLLYNGQLLLCLFAGAGLAQALAARPGRASGVFAALLLLAALPSFVKLTRALPAALAADAASREWTPPGATAEYGRALAWLRAHASHDAVVFADNPSMLLTALGELRLFYETGLYTTRARELGPGREPWPERAALQRRLLRRPDRPAVDEARHAIGVGRRLFVVADAVQSRVESGFVLSTIGTVPGARLFPETLFELRFANRTLHVYEAREGSARVSPR